MGTFNIDRLKGKPYFNSDGWWVSPFNFVDEVRDDLESKRVTIHDVTLRDGEQTFGVAFSPDDRVRIAEALDEMKVPRIEVGMPPASPDIMKGIKRVVEHNLEAEVIAFIRTMKDDIEMSIDCGVKTVILEHITNPYACEQAYGLEKGEVIDRIVSSVIYAKEKGLRTIFMGWDLTRGDDLQRFVTLFEEFHRVLDGLRVALEVP